MGQGTVLFNNHNAGLVMVGSTPSRPVGAGLGGVQLAYALAGYGTPWVAVSPYSAQGRIMEANPNWFLSPVIGSFTAPGIFDGGTLELWRVPENHPIDYVVFAWTGRSPTFDTALISGGAVGISEMFTTFTGTAGNPVNIADTFGGMTITLIPEPSAATLALLGTGVLFRVRWSRRR